MTCKRFLEDHSLFLWVQYHVTFFKYANKLANALCRWWFIRQRIAPVGYLDIVLIWEWRDLQQMKNIFLLSFQMFWLLEHPHEKARMQGFQRQVLSERDHFVHHVFNLTSALSNREMQNVKLHLLNSKNMIDPERGKKHSHTHFCMIFLHCYILFTFAVAFAIPKFCLDLLPFAKWNCEIAMSPIPSDYVPYRRPAQIESIDEIHQHMLDTNRPHHVRSRR